MDSLLNLEEVATFLRVSEKTVKEWANKGELPGGKLGTAWRFRRGDIEDWVARQLAPQKKAEHSRGYSMQALLRRNEIYITDEPTKNDMLNFIIDKASEVEGVKSRAQLADAIFTREDLMSTGIGLSIGIPHVRLAGIKDIHIFITINQTPLTDYDSLDGEAVQIVVTILAGENGQREHIQTLSAVASLLKNELIRKQLLVAKSNDEIYNILIQAEVKNEQ